MKDLGILVDSELTFFKHIHDKINVAYKMLGIIRRNFNFMVMDKFTFLTLYKSLVRSHLEYANSVWCPYKISLIRDVEKIQKRATKLVKQCKFMPYKERLKYLQLPTLKYRRLRGDMIEVYKIISQMYESLIAPVILKNNDTRTRGNSYKLLVERSKLDIRKFSFCSRIVNAWNSLPNEVIQSASINGFKTNLDRWWKNKDIYYDYESSLLVA